MNDIDDIGRRAGADAKRQAERSTDARHGLNELRSASQASTKLYFVETDGARRMTPRAWVALGSAMAVAAAVVVVLVTIRDPGERVLPATVPTEVDSTDAPTNSTIATTIASAIATTAPTSLPDSTAPTTVPSVGSGLKVSYLEPPPPIQPEVFAVVPVPGLTDAAEPAIAVGESGVAVLHTDGTGVTLIGPDSLSREVVFATGVVVSEIALGPSDVLYGLTFRDAPPAQAVPEAAIVAIALSGPGEGAIVAEAALPAVAYVELPRGVFGHGQHGIIDRARFGGQLIEYVATDGTPLAWTGEAPTEFSHGGVDDTVQSTAGTSWSLGIERDPRHSSSFVGDPPPAAAPDGRGVYATSIGASIGPDQDYSKSRLPVVATLNPDGSAEWALLPEGWQLGASDVWGTVLAHVGQDSTVELAWLIEPDFKTSLPEDVGYRTEPIDIESSCIGDVGCTTLAVDRAGVIVTFDPATTTMTVHDTPARTFAVGIDVSAGGYLIEATDAGVAYLLVSDPAALDPVGTLYAVSTTPSNAGSVVASVPGMDMSGDSDLVADELGLVVVGCCAFDERRPPFDAPVVMRWRTTERCRLPSPRGSTEPICWTSQVNPTAQHQTDAGEHRKTAEQHRAAAETLRKAEAGACGGIADEDRDTSPFYHREDIVRVEPIQSEPPTRGGGPPIVQGAKVTFRAVPGLTAEWLQRVVTCHLARSSTLGHNAKEMDYCPLSLKDVTATVTSVGDGFAIAVRSDNRDSAKEILRRAESLKAR